MDSPSGVACDFRLQIVMWFSGMRGIIAFALALNVGVRLCRVCAPPRLLPHRATGQRGLQQILTERPSQVPGSNHDLIVGSTLLLVVMSIGFFGLGTVPLLRVVRSVSFHHLFVFGLLRQTLLLSLNACFVIM